MRGSANRDVLKAEYLDCFAARNPNSQTLLEVIKSLLQLGVARGLLFQWAVIAGYSPATVRSVNGRDGDSTRSAARTFSEPFKREETKGCNYEYGSA